MTAVLEWRRAAAVYFDRRIVLIALMGLSSGLPLPLTAATLAYWLSKVGVDKTSIGLFALVGLPYSLKFLWAPVMDHVRLPFLTRAFGRRRGWALASQAGLMAAIVGLAGVDPASAPWATAAAALVVAFFSASQDIVIDAYRIEILDEARQGAGAAATGAGYRAGLIVAGAGALALADFIDWSWVFAILAGFVAIGMAAVLLAPEPAAPGDPPADRSDVREWLRMAVVEPFADFARRRGWILILAFVLLYKFGDAIAGTMANPFYVELGFTGTEIASISKVWGVVFSLLGTLAGGLMVARLGTFRALLVGGVLQAVTNLLFAWQAAVGHDVLALALTIGADNFTGGLGGAAFVAYLSGLCSLSFTGTQYALLTSFMAQGRTVLASGSGWLADHADWATFFVLTTGLAIPGLILLMWLARLQAPARA